MPVFNADQPRPKRVLREGEASHASRSCVCAAAEFRPRLCPAVWDFRACLKRISIEPLTRGLYYSSFTAKINWKAA